MSNILRKPIHTIGDAERFVYSRALPDKIDWESFYAHGKRNPPLHKPDDRVANKVVYARQCHRSRLRDGS